MVSIMTKKCIGCGITLQDSDETKAGYTKRLGMDLCMRCFKLRNYNELISTGVNIDNKELLNRINTQNTFTLFLVDYLSIYDEVIRIYKSIKGKKMLVITKSDLIYKNIIKEDLIANIKDIYGIKEDILFVSSSNNYNLDNLRNICCKYKNILVTGFTNAGKSSLINALVGSKITVSNRCNTTQDFMKIKGSDFVIYDAPGFISSNTLDNIYSKNPLVPFVYQMDAKYYLSFNNINLYFKENSNITLYLNKQLIAKLKVKDKINTDIVVPSNSDLVIKGIGFIRFKSASIIGLNINKEYYEIRPTIIGGHHE